MILLHGTTRRRQSKSFNRGRTRDFRSPADNMGGGFSMCLEAGPFLFGTPELYARGKAAEFPDEGGPVILVVDIPQDIIARAINEWFPLSQGLVQFDPGAGLEELAAAWLTLPKRIVDVPDE